MAPDEKPYRVYKGGRVKGKVPAPRRASRARRGGDGGGRYRGPGAIRTAPRGSLAFLKRIPWRRWLPIGLAALIGIWLIWAGASFFAVRSGVSAANNRLDPAARAELTHQGGLLTSHATTILVLGIDNAPILSRRTDRHSDSIMLVRTDPSHHRIAYLSIPRDLRVPVPGVGDTKINAAMQIGGPALAIKTVQAFTGMEINHVIVVNFADFKDLIDALGGVTIDVPRAIVSNRFDCPFATQTECQNWQGWRFHKGPQHMNGRQALIYSRIRENRLDPAETDFTRQARQQAVTQAVLSKFTSFSTLLGLPFDGGSVVKPIATDLSTWQLVELGWVKFRSSSGSAFHCRLGGDFGPGGSGAPSEDNLGTIATFLGKSAPQPPASTFGPGCAVGHQLSQ
jgi:polyisoprenyl-teichoic acid--peptidoglycan teichoic acid transferase